MHFHISAEHLELLFHKCISLFHYALSIKKDESIIPTSIFDPHHVSNITKGRKITYPEVFKSILFV